jgi:hypothetical protein
MAVRRLLQIKQEKKKKKWQKVKGEKRKKKYVDTKMKDRRNDGELKRQANQLRGKAKNRIK